MGAADARLVDFPPLLTLPFPKTPLRHPLGFGFIRPAVAMIRRGDVTLKVNTLTTRTKAVTSRKKTGNGGWEGTFPGKKNAHVNVF